MPTASQSLLPKTARHPLDRAIEMDQGYWRVAYVKPRNEKALAAQCQEMDVGFFLPLYEKRTRRKDTGKFRKSVLPLFPGYFPFVDRENGRLKVLETNRIVNIIDVLDQEQFVHDLSQIWQAALSGAVMEPCQNYAIGSQVRIKEGPMQGLVGTVENTTKASRLLLSVEMFNMAVSVELDQISVEKLP
ncbi:hypothetical protein GF373_14095 [bacterium]|nr:hypothetical protein [bacterium]